MPVRVLHIVENLDVGAVENWLIRMFMHSVDADAKIEWTFYCALGRPGRLDQGVRDRGGKIVYARVPISQTWSFLRHLRSIVRQGNYDVVHCHHDFVSGLYLLAALGLPVRRRIVHVHNADVNLPTPSRLKTFLLREPLRQACLRLSDQILGISNHTLDTFLDGKARRHLDRVVYYGVDTRKFHSPPPDPVAFRAQFGFPPEAKVVLFAGRMCWFKNPLFVFEILLQLRTVEPAVVGLFAGTGPLIDNLADAARTSGMDARVRILGWRDDVDTLMQGSDIFVFPRVETVRDGVGKEGLGLTVVEAQAAGTPVLMSHGVPEDTVVVPEMVTMLPLETSAVRWAEECLAILQSRRVSRRSCLARVESSRFALNEGVKNLLAVYRGIV